MVSMFTVRYVTEQALRQGVGRRHGRSRPGTGSSAGRGGSAMEAPLAELSPEELVRRRQWLLAVPLFGGLSDAFADAVARIFVPRTVKRKTVVIQKDSLGEEEMFFVAKGEVEALIELGAPAFATLGPGKFFGESSLLEAAPRNAFVQAPRTALLYVLRRGDLEPVLERFPDANAAIQSHIAQRAVERQEAAAARDADGGTEGDPFVAPEAAASSSAGVNPGSIDPFAELASLVGSPPPHLTGGVIAEPEQQPQPQPQPEPEPEPEQQLEPNLDLELAALLGGSSSGEDDDVPPAAAAAPPSELDDMLRDLATFASSPPGTPMKPAAATTTEQQPGSTSMQTPTRQEGEGDDENEDEGEDTGQEREERRAPSPISAIVAAAGLGRAALKRTRANMLAAKLDALSVEHRQLQQEASGVQASVEEVKAISQARVAAAAADGEAEKAGAVQKHPAAEAQQGGSTGAGADAVTRALAEEREENARLRAKLADAAEEVAQLRTTTEQAQRDAEDLKAQLQACKEAQLQAETARLVAESSAFSQSEPGTPSPVKSATGSVSALPEARSSPKPSSPFVRPADETDWTALIMCLAPPPSSHQSTQDILLQSSAAAAGQAAASYRSSLQLARELVKRYRPQGEIDAADGVALLLTQVVRRLRRSEVLELERRRVTRVQAEVRKRLFLTSLSFCCCCTKNIDQGSGQRH
jgi:CRP-like cAMP-binding protein